MEDPGASARLRTAMVWIGWDPGEMEACTVALWSIVATSRSLKWVSRRLALAELCAKGLYWRQTDRRGGRLWDMISDAPMSTEHAISRFFVPYLSDFTGWALFVDGDVLFRADVADLFALADPQYAVQVVQHPPLLKEGVKKDGAAQLAYPRKNWSSVMLFNCGHPANRALTLDTLNTWPGRDLHAFRWLGNDQIGALPARWNHLVNVNPPCADPALVHFTEGVPLLPDHARDPFADEWFRIATSAGYRFPAPAVRI